MARKPRQQSVNAPAATGSVIGSNSDAVKAANRAQLLSYVAKINPDLDELDGAKTVVKNIQGRITTTYRLAKAAGFPRGELEDLIADIRSRDTPAQQDREVRRIEWRRSFNLPIGETDELELQMPQEARDEVYFANEGFRAGMSGLSRDLPAGIPPRMDQIWMRNFDRGVDEFKAIALANVPGGQNIVAAQAAADFAEDEAAARKAANKVKDSDFMKTGGPDADAGDDTQSADAFAATQEELAEQQGRPSAATDII